jgi:hypothetical protein
MDRSYNATIYRMLVEHGIRNFTISLKGAEDALVMDFLANEKWRHNTFDEYRRNLGRKGK